ncbi:MAG: hypothetical protein JO189_31940 [Deltaproteobacteria bacterium]|nr:hypothetical protein [Deltaproteobacteria bacterium]
MILSKKFSFVFIKGKRVGGTSVEMALSMICGARDIITPIAPIDELERMRRGARAQNYAEAREREEAYIQQIQTAPRHTLAQVSVPKELYYNHMPLREVMAVYGPSVSSFDIVCVERSPFAKILSWANWLASAESYLSGGKLQTDLNALRCSVDRIFDSGEFAEVKNIDLYRGEDGSVAARMLRHENLEADLRTFLSSRGVSKLPDLPQAKAGLLSDRLDPREFFSKDQLRRINDIFSDEFDTFSYSRLL